MSLSVLTRGGASGGSSGPTASIFVTGLSENNVVTATKDGKTVQGKWVSVEYDTEIQIPTMSSSVEQPDKVSAYIYNTNPSNNPCRCFYHKEGDTLLESNYFSAGASGSGVSCDPYYVQYDFDKPITPTYLWYGVPRAGSKLIVNRLPKTFKFQALVNDEWIDISDIITTNASQTAQVSMEVPVINPIKASSFRLKPLSISDNYDNFYYPFWDIRGIGTTSVSAFVIKPIKSFGMWTVTATDGEQTVTQDVLVDAIAEYEIEMEYNLLWLYREGDECEEVTGGWEANTYTTCGNRVSSGTATKNDTNLQISAPGIKSASFVTANKIDTTGYAKLHFNVIATTCFDFCLTTEKTGEFNNSCINDNKVYDIKATGLYYMDVSKYQGLYYVNMVASGDESGAIDKIWLEK